MAQDVARATRRPRPNVRILALVLAVLVAIAWEAWRWYERQGAAGRLSGSGSIEASEVDISPQVPGRVITLLAKEGDRVRAGQVLASLEPQESEAQVARARAAVRGARALVVETQQAVATQRQVTLALVTQAQSQVSSASTRVPQSEAALAIGDRTTREAVSAAEARFKAAQAQVGSTRSALTAARWALDVAKRLVAQGAVAADQVDAAQAAYDAAVAQDRSAAEGVAQARANLATARANLRQVEIQREAVTAARANLAQSRAGLANAEAGYTVIAQRQQDLAAAQAALAQAQAKLRYLQVIAGHNTLVAPRDGVIRTKNVVEGEVVAAGAALYTMLNLQDMWVRIYVHEDQIGRVKIGQAARVTVPAIPGREFRGRVTEINAAPEFTTVNVQTKQDRVKLLFGVKIHLDNGDHSLQPGMPAAGEIFVADRNARPARGAGDVLAHAAGTRGTETISPGRSRGAVARGVNH